MMHRLCLSVTLQTVNFKRGKLMCSKNKIQGFTLLEMMIVVMVIGILAAIAYPAYSEYVQRGHRSEGQAALLDLAARQERFFAQNMAYASSLAALGAGTQSASGKYTVHIAAADTSTFSLLAVPTFADRKCGNLAFDSRGVKAVSRGVASECWR